MTSDLNPDNTYQINPEYQAKAKSATNIIFSIVTIALLLCIGIIVFAISQLKHLTEIDHHLPTLPVLPFQIDLTALIIAAEVGFLIVFSLICFLCYGLYCRCCNNCNKAGNGDLFSLLLQLFPFFRTLPEVLHEASVVTRVVGESLTQVGELLKGEVADKIDYEVPALQWETHSLWDILPQIPRPPNSPDYYVLTINATKSIHPLSGLKAQIGEVGEDIKVVGNKATGFSATLNNILPRE